MKARRTKGLLGGLVLAALCCGSAQAAEWRDLNHNGQKDPYEDPEAPIERRVEDLLGRMTLEEKTGTLAHGTLPGAGPTPGAAIGISAGGYDMAKVRDLVDRDHMSSFITRLDLPPAQFAEQNNAVQRAAEESRLGIPATISTDPRNHFQAVVGASTRGKGFSAWPETLGFAALRDEALVRRFGAAAAREYRAVGIHMALSPQADIGVEPRWPRITATFGSDPSLVSRMAGAYVEGFQGGRDGVTRSGVATIVKHWVGYGAATEGYDGHNYYGRNVTLDNRELSEHIRAFDGALAAHSAGVMPTYVVLHGVTLDGKPAEPVGAGFSKPLLTGLLRGGKGFDGLIVSDWSITRDCPERCSAPSAEAPQMPGAIGMPWGVEGLTVVQRFAKGIDAGLDQFGGIDSPDPITQAVKQGLVSEARIDESVRRVLRLKFELGLFDQPFVDPRRAEQVLGDPAVKAEADAAQRASQVLLRNEGGILPLRRGARVWLQGLDPEAARAAGLEVVTRLEDADAAIVRSAAPFETLHPYHFFGSRQHEGRLEFRDTDPDMQAIRTAAARVPVIVAIEMDRPAVLTAMAPHTRAILATFGASDAAVADVVAGKARARGRLPFDLPRFPVTTASRTARDKPLYPRGSGLGAAPGD